ncbi:UNVERIFIED_CONTAM: hypothetical protein HDU68_009355 [Siphonaria sp. JEL0065]|nr:hypothetical protein HDU68_009355 [Siphonaria sp. JEL0065]
MACTKIGDLEKSFKKVVDWCANTGQGILNSSTKTEAKKEAEIKAYLKKLCPFYEQLELFKLRLLKLTNVESVAKEDAQDGGKFQQTQSVPSLLQPAMAQIVRQMSNVIQGGGVNERMHGCYGYAESGSHLTDAQSLFLSILQDDVLLTWIRKLEAAETRQSCL